MKVIKLRFKPEFGIWLLILYNRYRINIILGDKYLRVYMPDGILGIQTWIHKSLNWPSCFHSCPLHFILPKVTRIISLKFKWGHVIPLIRTTQQLSIFFRINPEAFIQCVMASSYFYKYLWQYLVQLNAPCSLATLSLLLFKQTKHIPALELYNCHFFCLECPSVRSFRWLVPLTSFTFLCNVAIPGRPSSLFHLK